MPEQLIDTRFPGQQFPVGSVVTLLDRHRRTVFPAVTELRRHEAIVGGGETGRWRVRYARLQLITAGPTDRTRDHRARPRTRRRAADSRAAHRVHGEALQHGHAQPEAVDGGVPRCRDRWFRQRLTAKVRQRSICPRRGSHIAWRINAHGEGR